MKRPQRWILLAALSAASMAGCATKTEEVAKPAPAPMAQMVGRVASIDAAGRYVLIQVFGTWTVPDEVLLLVRSATSGAATLRPSGERQGRYVAADIVSGKPAPGDAVIYVPANPAASPPGTPNPVNPVNPAGEPDPALETPASGGNPAAVPKAGTTIRVS